MDQNFYQQDTSPSNGNTNNYQYQNNATANGTPYQNPANPQPGYGYGYAPQQPVKQPSAKSAMLTSTVASGLIFGLIYIVLNAIVTILIKNIYNTPYYSLVYSVKNLLITVAVIAAGAVSYFLFNSTCKKSPLTQKYKLPLIYALAPAGGYVIAEVVTGVLTCINSLFLVILENLYSMSYSTYNVISSIISGISALVIIAAIPVVNGLLLGMHVKSVDASGK